MLLDRLRNGRSFASIHPGNLHLSQCGEKYITSRIALRFARAVGQELVNPLTPVLVTGAALSAVTGSLLDAGLISAVFGLNAVIGGVERYQAEAAIHAMSGVCP